MNGQADFYISQLKCLTDGKVIGFIKDKNSEYYGLIIKNKTGEKKAVWLYSDDEGNAPGSFEITDC